MAYWNQEDYDRAQHKIHQKRFLTLNLEFTWDCSPAAGFPVDIVVRKETHRGHETPLRRYLDDEGGLSEVIEYPESMIDVVLNLGEHESCENPLTLTYHWYQPGQWFDTLRIEDDISKWKCTTRSVSPDYHAELDYPKNAIPYTASIRFGTLLGIGFSARNEDWTEASVSFQKDRKVTIAFHMRAYFRKWIDNISDHPKKGDTYPIRSMFTFMRKLQCQRADRQDGEFEPIEYDGLVNAEDHNPFLEIPSLEPEEQVIATVKRNVVITDEMLAPAG